MCVDPNGNIYFINLDGQIKRILYGTSDFDSFELNYGSQIRGLCSDSAGNIYIGGNDWYIKRILYGTFEWDSKELIADGSIRYFRSDSFGNIYVVCFFSKTIRRIIPGTMSWDDDNFKFTDDGNIDGICIDVYNNIYISFNTNDTSITYYIKKISYNASTDTYSWDSSFNILHNINIYNLCSDSIGNIYIGDAYGYIKRIPYNSSSFDSLNLYIGNGTSISGLCIDHNDNIYIGVYDTYKISRILHGTDAIDPFSIVYSGVIRGINTDSDNNIYVYGNADYILKLSSTGCSITYDSTTHTLKFTDENDPSYTSSITLTQT